MFTLEKQPNLKTHSLQIGILFMMGSGKGVNLLQLLNDFGHGLLNGFFPKHKFV